MLNYSRWITLMPRLRILNHQKWVELASKIDDYAVFMNFRVLNREKYLVSGHLRFFEVVKSSFFLKISIFRSLSWWKCQLSLLFFTWSEKKQFKVGFGSIQKWFITMTHNWLLIFNLKIVMFELKITISLC